VLDEARLLRLPRVLAIERYGGVLEDVRDTHEGVKRRYWISW
jgi:hypothetical protein